MAKWFELDISDKRLSVYKELLGQDRISPLEIEFMCRLETRIGQGDDLTNIEKIGSRITLLAPRNEYMLDYMLQKWQQKKLVNIYVNEFKDVCDEQKYGVSYVIGFDESLRLQLLEKLQ